MTKYEYTLQELRRMRTLATGQADDLKVDDGSERHWLSRTEQADGVRHPTVFVERKIEHRWVQVRTYQAE